MTGYITVEAKVASRTSLGTIYSTILGLGDVCSGENVTLNGRGQEDANSASFSLLSSSLLSPVEIKQPLHTTRSSGEDANDVPDASSSDQTLLPVSDCQLRYGSPIAQTSQATQRLIESCPCDAPVDTGP